MDKGGVTVEVFIGLSTKAVTQKCIPAPSKCISISGSEVSEIYVCC
jgi:hypothetical protein